MNIYESDNIKSTLKPDGTPITDADKRAHEILQTGISVLAPDIPIISEEDSNSQISDLPPKFFLLDPLDGTKEFLSHRPEFTVNIALIEYNAPTLGVIYAPALDRLFSGVVGEGAVESSSKGTFTITPTSPPPNDIRALTSISHPDSQSLEYLQSRNITNITSVGSSYKFCLLSCGEADLYARFSPTMAWDTAAGDAILRSSGGRVINADTNALLEYGKGTLTNPSFIASTF